MMVEVQAQKQNLWPHFSDDKKINMFFLCRICKSLSSFTQSELLILKLKIAASHHYTDANITNETIKQINLSCNLNISAVT